MGKVKKDKGTCYKCGTDLNSEVTCSYDGHGFKCEKCLWDDIGNWIKGDKEKTAG